MRLHDRVAVVTGATRGVGRGVARALAEQGARVFIAGRSVSDDEQLDERTTAIRCDHRNDDEVDAAFARIIREANAIDILVNNVWGGYEEAATDKLTSDMAIELRPHGVTVVSLYPGLVRTEKVMEAAQWLDLSNSESPEFIGRAVASLAADPDVIGHTGKVLVAAALAQTYDFADVDGKTPRPLTIADV